MVLLDPQIVVLSGHIRHVRTAEGAKFYGLPIGTPITADLIAKIDKERKGAGYSVPDAAHVFSDSPISDAELDSHAANGLPVTKLGKNYHVPPHEMTAEHLDTMHPGAHISSVSANGSVREYTRNEDGTWDTEFGPIPANIVATALQASDTAVVTHDGTPAPKAHKSLKPGDNIDSPDHLASLPDGTHVQHKITKSVYKKQGDTLLSTTGGYNKKFGALKKVFAQQNLKYHSKPAEDDSKAVDTNDPEGPNHQPGTVLTHDQVGALPAGHQIQYGTSKNTYTANGDGTFTGDTSKKVLDHSAFQQAADGGKISYLGLNGKKEQDGAGAADAAGGEPGAGDAVPGGPGGVSEGVSVGQGDDGSGNPDGNGSGLALTFGGEATVLHEVPAATDLPSGVPSYPLYELDPATSAGAFRNAIAALKDGNKYAASVYVYDEADYKDMRLFLNKEGTAGFALHGDDIVSVFAHKQAAPGSSRQLLATATAQGGKRLDAYDTVLPSIYADAGFRAVARVKWDDQYAPEGWDKTTFGKYNHGEPDVVFMVHDPNHTAPYTTSDGVTLDTYDDGAKVQAEYLASGKIKQPNAAPLGKKKQWHAGESLHAVDDVTALPNKSVVQVIAADGSPYEYRKESDNEWSDLTTSVAGGFEDQDFDSAFNAGLAVTVKSLPKTAAQKVQDDLDNGTLKAYDNPDQDQQKKVPSAPKAPKAPSKPKDKEVTSQADLDALDAGSQISIETPSGNTVHMTLGEDGFWRDDEDPDLENVSSAFGDGLHDGTMHITKAVPKPAAVSEEDFKALGIGSQVVFTSKNGSMQKIEAIDGGWENLSTGMQFTTDELAVSAAKGKIHVVHATPAVPGSTPPSEPTMDTTPGIQVWANKVVSKHDLQQVYDALNAHSGFQVKYGLKSIPDNPLNTDDNIHGMQQAAQAAYPGTPIKAATLKYLQAKLGIQSEDTAASAADAVTIHVGKPNPKQVGVQGMDGGDYTVGDVKDAISILENFNGKAFKSELVKKGSPLGALNPVAIITPDKDKTKNKAAFIQHLKEVLDAHEKSLPSEGPAAEAAGILPEPDSDAVPENTAVVPSVNHLIAMPAGSKVYWGAHNSDSHTAVFTKGSDGKWTSPDSYPSSSQDFADTIAKGYLRAEPHLLDLPQMHKASLEQMHAAPAGTPFTYGINEPNGPVYIKQPNGGLKDEQTGHVVGPFVSTAHAQQGALWMHEQPKPSTAAKSETPAYQPGDIVTHESFAKVPVGESVLFKDAQGDGSNDHAYANTPKGWVNSDSGMVIAPQHFKGAIDAGLLVHSEPAAPIEHENAPVGDIPAEHTFTPGAVVTADLQSLVQPGDGIKLHPDAYATFYKQNDGSFVNPATGNNFNSSDFWGLSTGHVYVGHDDSKIWDNEPDGPQYAQVPGSADASTYTDADASTYTSNNAIDADLGTILVGDDGTFYTKTEDSGHYVWIGVKDGKTVSAASNVLGGSFAKKIDSGAIKPYVTDGPNEGNILVGKYSSGGKATMFVKADGSGVYVGANGAVKALTPAAVKKNHAAGMNVFLGVPDSVPAPTPAAKKAVPKTVIDLADGTYYSANPNSAKANTYVIEGDSVKMFKPQPVKVGGQKVGYQGTEDWAQAAGTGAVMKHVYAGKSNVYTGYNYQTGESSYGDFPVEEYTWTKQADGTWQNMLGEPKTWDEMAALAPYSKKTVVSHGLPEPTILTKAKANTLFSQGKLLDEYGNSVMPQDYTGTVTLLGYETTVPLLVKAKKHLAEGGSAGMLNQIGVSFDNKLAHKYADSHSLSIVTAEDRKAMIAGLIDDALAGVELPETDDTDAKKLFEYDSLGNPKFPAGVATVPVPPYYASTGDFSAYMKKADEAFGGGGIIGQGYGSMDKNDKYQWVQAFKAGNFQTMYQLEVAALGSKGKAHPNGYKHPGFIDNTETHKVKWAPAVEGEKAAGVVPEGNWTSMQLNPSKEEVSNYLIAAFMQNPTYLDLSERRQWMQAHRNGNQDVVNQLSVTALNRKTSGQAPLTAPLVWTDDVKPAKSYDHYFETTEFPYEQFQAGGYQESGDWYNDNVAAIPALKDAATAYVIESGYPAEYIDNGSYVSKAAKEKAVVDHFQALADEAAARALIPVFSKDAQQSVKSSTHPIFNYHDQFGQKYFFKPSPGGDAYRSEAEHLGNEFGRAFGFSTAGSSLETLGGKYGNLQKDVGGVGDLLHADYGSLTAQQIADIGMEHLLDHMLDNDDTKGDNAKILSNGRIVGIDKGRAFKHYGAWQGLSAGDAMDSNAPTIYNRLYTAIRSGKLSKEQVDQAYLTIMKRARKMEKFSDARSTEMLAEGMKNRQVWDIKYTIDGKKVPSNLAGLTAAFLDRKSHLGDDFEQMWKGIYKQAGYGDLPEVPVITLHEDKPSGLDDAYLHEKALSLNSHGKATSMGSGDFAHGSALLWTDHTNGTKNLNGETVLMPLAQGKVLSWMQAHSKNASPSKSDPSGLSVHDVYGDNFIGAAKTINHHAADEGGPQYNADKISQWQAAADLMEQDRQVWKPDMVGNADGGDSYMFPSGQKIPMKQVDQYKLMLDFYHEQHVKIDEAYQKHSKTGVISKYEPVALGNPPASFVKANSNHKLTKLANGSFIYNDGETLSVTSADDDRVKQAVAGEDGWTPLSDQSKEIAEPVQVVYGSTHDKVGSLVDGKLVYSDQKLSHGVQGSEYEVTLPTGEKIWFRNGSHTGTVKSQEGKLTFRLHNLNDESDSQASMARVMAQLQVMGLSTEGADHDTAERTYWRAMYPILSKRKHKAGSKYEKAWAELRAKQKEVGANSHEYDPTFLEKLSQSHSVDDENAFWRELWSKHFGKDKVDELIATEGYLPQYDAMDYGDIETGTGKPKFRRVDVSAADFNPKGRWLASSNTSGSDGTLVKAVRSGGLLSTEERMRFYGDYIGGMSSTADQSYGSSHGIYTRVVSSDGASHGNYAYFYNPNALLHTSTYSFSGDNYGNVDSQASSAPSDTSTVLGYNGGSNETMLPDTASLFGDLEVIAFDSVNSRDEAIQALKKRGIDTIRGLPVEDRLVMRSNLKAALKKVEATW